MDLFDRMADIDEKAEGYRYIPVTIRKGRGMDRMCHSEAKDRPNGVRTRFSNIFTYFLIMLIIQWRLWPVHFSNELEGLHRGPRPDIVGRRRRVSNERPRFRQDSRLRSAPCDSRWHAHSRGVCCGLLRGSLGNDARRRTWALAA